MTPLKGILFIDADVQVSCKMYSHWCRAAWELDAAQGQGAALRSTWCCCTAARAAPEPGQGIVASDYWPHLHRDDVVRR